MNERDYKIFEITILLFGLFTSFIMMITAFVTNILEPVSIFLLLPLLFGISSSIYLHVKRKQYIKEMLSYLKRWNKLGKWSTIQYRNFNDFKFGSFTTYVTEKETVVRGILKKTNQPSLYQLTKRRTLWLDILKNVQCAINGRLQKNIINTVINVGRLLIKWIWGLNNG